MNEPTSLLQQTWLDTTKDNTQRLARGLPSPAAVQERGLPKGDSGLNMLENRNFWRCCCTVHSSVGEAVFPHRVVFSGRLLYYPAVVRCHLPQPQLARSALSLLLWVLSSLLCCFVWIKVTRIQKCKPNKRELTILTDLAKTYRQWLSNRQIKGFKDLEEDWIAPIQSNPKKSHYLFETTLLSNKIQ